MPCRNLMSVDVEDYFQVEAFSSVVDRSAWDQYPCRVEDNTRRVLDLLDECGVKATFFVLGWVAERYPATVGEIVRRGHEPACHSYWHRLIYALRPEEFREDTRRAKDCIEQAADRPVIGYRAPSFSITARSSWAPAVLAELGFRYDSSIFPVLHDTYGVLDAPRRPFRLPTQSGTLAEFPMTTFRLGFGPNLPVAGGGYLRMLPYWYTRLGLRRVWSEGLPVIAYAHPWELDPEQPRIQARLKSRLRHYTNLSKMAGRLRLLLSHGEFGRYCDFDMADLKETFELRAEA